MTLDSHMVQHYVNYLICIFMNINENLKKLIKTEKKISKTYLQLTIEQPKGTQKWHSVIVKHNKIFLQRMSSTTSITNFVSMTTRLFLTENMWQPLIFPSFFRIKHCIFVNFYDRWIKLINLLSLDIWLSHGATLCKLSHLHIYEY